jgi:ribose-phosphate pyrophosphokinase
LNPLLLAFPGAESLARGLVRDLPADAGVLHWRHFPDGESLLALEGDYEARDVVVLATLRDPDPTALPLLFAARTARELGARSVGLVAPYLAYMRQDARFRRGEAVSSLHFAAFLSWTFDWLVTVDPHLHRHDDFAGLFSIPAEHVSAMPRIAEWIRTTVARPVLIGPDSESAQWVEPLAALVGAPAIVLDKDRRGDRDVSVSTPARGDIGERTPVVVDDIASSGQTLIETLAQLRAIGTHAPVCVVVHGVFADAADEKLRAAGAAVVASCNTIEHATNAVDVTPVLLPAIERQLSRLRDAGRGRA